MIVSLESIYDFYVNYYPTVLQNRHYWYLMELHLHITRENTFHRSTSVAANDIRLAEADPTELGRGRRFKHEELNELEAPPVARLVVQLDRLNLPLTGRRTLW